MLEISTSSWDRHLRIVALRNSAAKTFLDLGKDLYEFDQDECWADLGHASMKAYLADPDVDIGVSVGFRLIRVYQKWQLMLRVPKRELLTINDHKLDALAPYTTADNRTENLAQASSLSESDLRKWIAETYILKSANGTPDLPPDKFNLIYADPPWKYDFSPTSGRKVERHYPTMDLDEIKSLEVTGITHDDCTLFLWGTSPKLPWAFEVMDAWGFEYKTCMVWVKDRIGMGYYARQQHELLLIGGKGESQLPEPDTRPSSVIMSPRTDHSRKPPEVYAMLEAMYPNANRVELFSREERRGWTAWGNEV